MSDQRVEGTVSRRRVVQGALWAAPAVVIATAVPAFAVASGATDGTMTVAGAHTMQRIVSANPRRYVFTDFAVAHGGGTGAEITNLKIVITVTSGEAMQVFAAATGGWTIVPGASTSTVFTFTYNAGTLANPGSATGLNVTLARVATGGGQGISTFSVVASGDTNGGTGNATLSIPVVNLAPA